MLCCVVLGLLIAKALPTSDQREASRAGYLDQQRHSCEKSCLPKSGSVTYESINPLHKVPNDVGYRRSSGPRCICSK